MSARDRHVNLYGGEKFLDTEVEAQGLSEVAAPAPVEIPSPETPRGGGFPIGGELGALARLPGTWNGTGFNLIARPDKQNEKPFFLELDKTKETLQFTPISGPIPNRGSQQGDISFLGLTYMQMVTDAITNGGLHVEPGIWLSVPPTTVPEAEATVVRLATVPHGNSLLAQGKGFTVDGPPTIEPVSTVPLDAKTQKPITSKRYLEPFETTPPPPGIPKGAIANPNILLTEAIKGQKIIETVVLLVSSKPEGGIENIPFLVENADAISMDAIFWIELVQLEGGTLLQLQYTQTVMLSFDGIDWPHVSVATLLKF